MKKRSPSQEICKDEAKSLKGFGPRTLLPVLHARVDYSNRLCPYETKTHDFDGALSCILFQDFESGAEFFLNMRRSKRLSQTNGSAANTSRKKARVGDAEFIKTQSYG